jgi:predicted house-cleaning noncanonical NTP pyrophosphatase (MazG superfamily)
MGKLVRDRIPEIIGASGGNAVVRVLAQHEYVDALLAKAVEEASELAEAPSDQRLEEAADVLEVLLAIVALDNRKLDDLVAAAASKRAKRGGFDERLWLES